MSLTRIAPLPESQWTDVHRGLVARFSDAGRVDPLLATLLRTPEFVEAVMPMTHYLTGASTLSPDHRFLLAVRTAWLEGSDAVSAEYAARAAREGLHVTWPPAAWHQDGDRSSQGLPRLADELVVNSSVSGSTWSGLAGQHDVTWLMDAVETVAHVSFMCCLASSFGVTPDDPGPGEVPVSLPSRQIDLQLPGREPPPLVARIAPIEGDQIAVLRTFARHPRMAAARAPRANFVNRVSRLTPHDRETLILRIGWDCRSEYEWAKHVGSVGHAREHGVDPLLVAAGPSAPGVAERDALLMRTADELHRESTVSDATWAALVELLDVAGAMSAVFTASSYRSTSMSLNAYAVQLEPGDEGFPPPGRTGTADSVRGYSL